MSVKNEATRTLRCCEAYSGFKSIRSLLAMLVGLVLSQQSHGQPIDKERPRLMAQIGHGSSRIEAVALSSDGKWLFTAGYNGTVTMWDFCTGKEVRSFEGLQEPIRSLALSSDGKWLVISGQKEAQIWDVKGSPMRTPWDKATPVSGASLSADDKWIVTRSEGVVRVWDVAKNTEARAFPDIGRPFAAILSRDGKLLVTNSSKWDKQSVETNVVRLWDVSNGKEIRTFQGHDRRVNSLTLSADDQWLVSTSDDKTARLWDLATGKELRTFEGHHRYVTCSVLSPAKKLLVTSGYDVTRVWNVETGKTLFVLPEKYPAQTLALTADGKQLVTGDFSCARLWDLTTGKEIRAFQGQAHHAYFDSLSSDGKRLVTHGDGYWDLATGKYVATKTPKAAEDSRVSRTVDGNWIIVSDDKSVEVRDTATGKKVRSLTLEQERLADLSSDGKLLVSADKASALHLWDLDAGKKIQTFKGHKNKEGSWMRAELSTDKKWLLSKSLLDCEAKCWDVATGKEILSVHNEHWWPPMGAMTTDSKWLAISNGKIVTLWELATLMPVRTFEGHNNNVVWLSFSGDGKWMITKGAEWGRVIDSHLSSEMDKDITYRVWEIATGKMVAEFKHPVWSFSAALTHDGKRLVTGSSDGTVRVRALPSGKELCCCVSFNDGSWAAFDADGRYDASNKDGIDGLYWVVGDETFPLQKFRDRHHDPGLLAKYLGFNAEPLKKLPPRQ